MSRFIASSLVSCSRASLAREHAASVNLERIQRCWVLQATFEEVERIRRLENSLKIRTNFDDYF